MALPALASVSALSTWLGAAIDDEDARAQAVLASASSLVRARAGENYVDTEGDLSTDIPDGIVQATVMCAVRMWLNPSGADKSSTGPFAAEGLTHELNEAECNLVDAAIGASRVRGIGTIQTTRSPLVNAQQWVDVEGGQQIEASMPDPTGRFLW